jgi:predicted ester cyclase
MKKRIKNFGFVILIAAGGASLCSCTNSKDNTQGDLQAKVDELQKKVDQYEADKKEIEKRLIRFDSLDYHHYNNQQWDSFRISHTDNIIVTYPDGHQTKDLSTHLEELKPQFQFAPDTKITSHPIKFGTDEYTCVIGEMEGTFTKPLNLGKGKPIPLTGKKFKIKMATIGKWENGKMTEEILFWDNMAFMQQIGVSQ